MDSVCLSLVGVVDVGGGPQVYVDSYIKAFYYAGESDVMQWIQMNWKSYAFRHMVGLLNAGVGPKKKKKAPKDLIVQVSSSRRGRRARVGRGGGWGGESGPVLDPQLTYPGGVSAGWWCSGVGLVHGRCERRPSRLGQVMEGGTQPADIGRGQQQQQRGAEAPLQRTAAGSQG